MKRLLAISILILLFCGISDAVLINRIVAVVNGEVITESDLVRFAKNIAIARNIDLNQIDEATEDEVVRESLNELIEDMLILSHAKSLGIKIDQKAIEARIATIKSGFNTEKDFLNRLERDGLSYDTLWQRIHDDILKTKTVDYFVRREINLHPQDVKDFYLMNQQDFIVPKAFRVEKIFIKKGSDSRDRIEQLRLLISKDVPFKDLAQNHSDSSSEDTREGEWLYQGRVSQKIADAVFSLDVGEVSDIVETENAYYIFKVVEKADSYLESLDKVKDKVYNRLYQIKFSEKFNQFILKLKENAQIDIKI